jgi:hypothetical protein
MAHPFIQLYLQAVIERGIPEKRGWQAAPTPIENVAVAMSWAIVTVSTRKVGEGRMNGLVARPVVLPADELWHHLVDIIYLCGAVNAMRAYVTNHNCSIGRDLTLNAQVILDYISAFRRPIDEGYPA